MSVHQPACDPALTSLVIDNLDRGVIAINGDGMVTLFNPAAENYLGTSARHVVGRPYARLFAGQESILYLVDAAMKEARSITDDQNILLQRPKLPPLPVSIYAAPIYDSSGRQDGAVMILRDLSRVRELEETLRRADRLAMLATLASGLAHEIRNPLGGIKGAAQLLAMELDTGHPLQEYARVMIRETDRINGIIEELMALGRPRPTVLSDVNLGKLISDIVLLQQLADSERRIEFSLTIDPSIPPLQGDERLLTRLFLNLIKNAREAVHGQGRVEVETRVSPDYHITTPGNRPSPMVMVRIRDNGQGISPEDLERIFTPYYSTKEEGSGLGLAICQKIVEDHRGILKVVSNPGAGTEVTVWLPLR